MCITPGSRLFVRADKNFLIEGKLADLNKSGVSPAAHMNYYGNLSYTDSGYISLLLYDPKKSYPYDGRNFQQSAALAIRLLNAAYVHFFFIPNTVQELPLNEGNVTSRPKTGRTPTLFNTDQCNPPAVRNAETGDVIHYANRYINEYLYSGMWAQDMQVFTEKADHSQILYLMSRRTSLDDICKEATRIWPCPPGDDDNPGGGSQRGSIVM